MSDKSKTRRFFDLISMLTEAGSPGIARETILAEFDISDKTFQRDIRELQQILPFIGLRYDADEDRIYGTPGALASTGTGKAGSSGGISSEIDSKINIFQGDGKSPAPYMLHIEDSTGMLISHSEFQALMDAVIDCAGVEFHYRDKEVQALPLFFCYYSEHWYLFCHDWDSGLVKKYRTDIISGVTRSLLSTGHGADPQEIENLKQDVISKINESQNIFLDLNTREKISILFRFFLPLDYLEKEIRNFKFESHPGKEDKNVVDIRMEFLGFYEARMFMNNWLGHFQILGPEDLRRKYLEELEEAVDII